MSWVVGGPAAALEAVHEQPETNGAVDWPAISLVKNDHCRNETRCQPPSGADNSWRGAGYIRLWSSMRTLENSSSWS